MQLSTNTVDNPFLREMEKRWKRSRFAVLTVDRQHVHEVGHAYAGVEIGVGEARRLASEFRQQRQQIVHTPQAISIVVGLAPRDADAEGRCGFFPKIVSFGLGPNVPERTRELVAALFPAVVS